MIDGEDLCEIANPDPANIADSVLGVSLVLEQEVTPATVAGFAFTLVGFVAAK